MSKIPFQVETTRVLEILSSQIYDSPYAMARENVQNGYDAVLIRASKEGRSPSEFSVSITASPQRIEICDEGIGMSEQVLRENFWRAGSSGKNNDEARAAGVIGTFGIGAMANFGVCERLQVDTRELGSEAGVRTVAVKSELRIGSECISMEPIDAQFPVGTVLTAEISPSSPINVDALRNYLRPFVQFLAIPVIFNGELLSQQNPREAAGIGPAWQLLTRKENICVGGITFNADLLSDGRQVAVIAENFAVDGRPSNGGMWLRQEAGQIMGLRSRFGLAPAPLPTHYQLGGYIDFPFLTPTAGREALTRDSIQQSSQLIPPIEEALSEAIKDLELADNLPLFQQHLLLLNRIHWAYRVCIQISPGDSRVELGKLKETFPNVDLHWYAGQDPDTISTFSSEDNPLVRVSQHSPRRELQNRYLNQVIQLKEIPQVATVLATYAPADLTWEEVSLTLSIARVLRTDYLIDDISVEWVKIGYNVPMLTEMVGERLIIRISRSWSAVQALLRVIDSTPEVGDGMTKDFVRVHVYDKIKSFVPSSQRAGLDALQKTLARRRELYRLEMEDRGELEPLLAEYIAGNVELGQVLTAASQVSSAQTQRVSSDAVGNVENVLNDVVNAAVSPGPVQPISAPVAGSPILRLDRDLRERLLTTDGEVAQLNNHRMFLALSDRLFQLERDFFMWPHSTQVAWAGRRIVFLFGLANSPQNLYYDIELRGARNAGAAGGCPLITTTIVTKNRIFVPVPPELMNCFKVADDPVEFYVRFDMLGHK